MEQTLERIEQSRKKATECVPHEEPSSMKPSIKEITKIDGNTTSYSIHGINANARNRVEQDVDLVLKNLKLKITGQPYDDVLLTTDKPFNYYKANEDRIILKDGLLSGKTTERLVTSNTTKSWYQSNQSMKHSGACTENLASTPELQKR